MTDREQELRQALEALMDHATSKPKHLSCACVEMARVALSEGGRK